MLVLGVENNDLTYTPWNDYYSKFSEYPLSHTNTKLKKWKKYFFLLGFTL